MTGELVHLIGGPANGIKMTVSSKASKLKLPYIQNLGTARRLMWALYRRDGAERYVYDSSSRSSMGAD